MCCQDDTKNHTYHKAQLPGPALYSILAGWLFMVIHGVQCSGSVSTLCCQKYDDVIYGGFTKYSQEILENFLKIKSVWKNISGLAVQYNFIATSKTKSDI